MTYHCDNCKTVLPVGAISCPGCGRKYDSPVPADISPRDQTVEDQTVEDRTVEDRTVGETLRGRSASRVAPPAGNLRPAWYGTPRPARRRLPRAASFIGAIVLLALLGWGAHELWVLGPGNGSAFRQYNFSGNAAAEHGDYQTAIADYTQMIMLRPDRDDGYLLRAISEFQSGQMSAAIRDNTEAMALTQDPETQGDLLYNRGEAYAGKGKFVQAISDYTSAFTKYGQERNPYQMRDTPGRMESCYRQRAEAYWQHKEYALAISDCSAAIGFGHARPGDYSVRGKAESALGQSAAADADLTQAVRSDPNDLAGYVALSELDNKRHQPAAAVALFQQAVRDSPGSEPFWGNLGWCQYEAGELPQALQSDQHARSLDAKPAWVTYNLALIYAVQGNSALAQEAYGDALSHSQPQDRLGALDDLHHALAKQPESAVLHQALAQVERGVVQGTETRLPVLPLPAPPKAPAPPTTFAGRLGPEVTIGGYGIQPPLGYTLTQRPRVSLSSSGTEYLWTSPVRADGTAATLQVVVSQDDGSLAAHSTSLQNAQLAIDLMQKNHTEMTETPAAAYPINGLPFAVGSWDGYGQRTGKEYRGSEYWLVSPYRILHLAVHDAVPYDRESLPLVSASVSTFRKL